jgi:transposase
MVQKSRDAREVRRALGVLRLSEGYTVTDVSVLLSGARSSIYQWLAWFQEHGVEGLRSQRGGRVRSTVSEQVVGLLGELLKTPPHAFNYLRSRWNSGLLAKEIRRQLGVRIHASTIRRLLPRMGYRWRRARPFLSKRDPGKRERLEAIDRALSRRDRREPVFFADEADIDLNPKKGWKYKKDNPFGPRRDFFPGGEKPVASTTCCHRGTGLVVKDPCSSSRPRDLTTMVRSRRYHGLRDRLRQS